MAMVTTRSSLRLLPTPTFLSPVGLIAANDTKWNQTGSANSPITLTALAFPSCLPQGKSTQSGTEEVVHNHLCTITRKPPLAQHWGESSWLWLALNCAPLSSAIRPTGDRQDRAAEVTCHLPPFTLLFLLTPELTKQFPLRRFTQ